ncbi:MAG: N-acetyltransferase [Candidatus Marinimicrobia bacterium]|nr:N-acetyltransferase [Candidatus Neomarinimicrobiota bacterium]
MGLVVEKVKNKSEMKKFIKLPWRIYEDDEDWVPPLLAEEKEKFNKEKYPFFEHSEADFFLARQDGKILGRIAAIKNNNHLDTYNDDLGFFGFFECINDQKVANALFNKAEQWLKKRGLKKIRGPENYTQNDEIGLLVDAFDLPPTIMMTYNPRYYIDLLNNYGFSKEKDVLAYVIKNAEEIPDRLARNIEIIEKRYDFTINQIDMKNFERDAEKVVSVYNEAWSKNWGAVKLTDSEIEHLKEQLKPILVPEMVYIAEVNGKPVGVSLTIPDVNRVLKDMNGRLLPTGIFKLLWQKLTGWKDVHFVRVLILGVLEEYRHMGIDMAFYYYTFKNGLKLGFNSGEMSWILEDNYPMRNALERLDNCHPYKTYRLYQKEIRQ